MIMSDIEWQQLLGRIKANASELISPVFRGLVLKSDYPENNHELRLNINQIGDPEAKELALALKENCRLRSLDLSSNQIGAAGAKELALLLKDNRVLTRLELNANQIGDAGAKELALALKENGTLTTLTLRLNKIGDVGAKELALALKGNRMLMRLELYANQIGDVGAKELALVLKGNPTLTVLALGDNQITDAGAKELALALKDNRTLIDLSLYNNKIGDAGVKELALALKDNHTFISLRLESNKIGDAGRQDLKLIGSYLTRNRALADSSLEAAYEGDLQTVIEGVRQGVSLLSSCLSLYSSNGNTLLHGAVSGGNLEVIQYVIKAMQEQSKPLTRQNRDDRTAEDLNPELFKRAMEGLNVQSNNNNPIDPEEEMLKTRIKELEDLVKLQQDHLDKFKNSLGQKDQEIDDLTDENDDLKQQLDQQQQQYDTELKSARTTIQQEQDQRQTLWQQQQWLVKNFEQDQQRREQLWQQQQKTLQTVEDTLQKERQNLQKRQDKIKQDKQRLATDKQRLQQEKLDCETQRKALEAHSTQQPAPDVQKQLDALKIKERELEDKAKAFEQREQSLQQLQQSNAQLEQRLEARAQELEQKDQGFADLKTAYAVLKQKLAVAETDRQKAAGIEDKLTQQEQELASLRTQLTQRQLSAPGVNTQDLATKIAEQEKTVHALQQQLAEAKQQAEQARNEALALKAQLDKQSAQVAQAAKSINPHFGAKASQWPVDYQLQHELFKATLEKIQAQYGQVKPLSCFVSYAWGEPTQETEVKRLVDYLKLAGFTIPFDRDNLPGQEPTHKFIQNINDVDFVVICGSKKMMEKYRWKPKTREDRQPVVKTELDLIESLITKNEYEQRRMRPVVFEGSVDESLPPLLRTYVYYHFQFVDYFDILFGLIQSLYGIRNDDAVYQGFKNEFQKQAEAIAQGLEVQSNNNSVHALVSPVDASQLQQLTEENQTLKQTIEKLESRIKALEATLFEKTQLKEEAAVTMQKVFRGFIQRKKQPLKSLQENRRQEVDAKLDEWFRAKKYKELAELGNLAESGQWHAAMQMIRGKPLQAKEAEIEIPAKTKDSVGHGKAWTIKFRY